MSDAQEKLSVYRIDDGGERFHVVAASDADALEVFRATEMSDVEEWISDPPRVSVVDDAKVMKFDDDGTKVEGTCRTLIELFGRGYLCGTVW